MSKLIPVILTVLLTGCASNVYTDLNQHYPFSKIETYDVTHPTSSTPTSLDDERVKQALIANLNQRKLTEVSVNPNVIFQYYISTKTEQIAYGPSFSFGYGYRNVGFGYDTPIRIDERDYGQLVIEMIDPKNNTVVWKAISRQKLTDSMSSFKKEELIVEQVADMINTLPESVGSKI
ncbi:DUF4136 domain-containing protein [Enterovibrio nigricans]|uniref:DUF4136 domain-containing protein n=1 Tax=Enterovibrio nigricans DSM 22720 TaxID=1121868 RepID=A0A1T4VFK9_9GAMM|nr:DUF4136 domain-containing protein [Enterovibrio nigricans]PKF49923.1 DUF4136 domain-containing protein [Enterovibrio nigricans]SKA63301.1 protein of unknown function [Enterovibrio nigricans DSM 22720]